MNTTSPGGVLCAGNLVLDLLLRPVDDVDWERTKWVESFETSLGGNGANTAWALAALGVPVRLWGAVGTDPWGDYVLARLSAVGVDVSGVNRLSASTARTAVLVDSQGRRAFLHHPGAGCEAFSEPLAEAGLRGAACTRFHLANPFALPHVRRHAGDMVRRAREAGMITSLDGGWDASGEWLRVIGPCLPHLDLLFLNLDEAQQLTGCESAEEAAERLLEGGARQVVIKMGARGCLWMDRQGSFAEPAFDVPVVDTTGAGDCFVAGFLASLWRGSGVREAAQRANAVAAFSVQSLGAVTGVRGWDETLEWMRTAPRLP